MRKQSLVESLETLGFSDAECRVLLFLLEHRLATPGLIAKRTQMKRTTTYSVLESLITKGMVFKTLRCAKSSYSLIDPQVVQNTLSHFERERHTYHLQALSALRVEMEQRLERAPQRIAEYEVSLHDLSQVYSVQLSALTAGNFDAVFDPAMVVASRMGKKVLERFLKVTGETQPHIRELVPPGTWTDWYAERIANPNHLLRLLPPKSRVPSDIVLATDCVYLLTYTAPEHALRIQEAALHGSLSTWFQALWEASQPLKTTR